MEKEQLTPLKLVHFPASKEGGGEHYEINGEFCCKDIGSIIVQRFPNALADGVNPIDLWISLYDSGDHDYGVASDILDELPASERAFIESYLSDFNDGRYDVTDEDLDDDHCYCSSCMPDEDDDDEWDDLDDDDDDIDLDEEELDDWDGDPDLGPQVD